MSPNTTYYTRGQHNASFFPQNAPPAPSRQLPVGNMTIQFMFWAFIGIVILLFVLVPCRLENPAIQENGVQTRVLCNTRGRIGQPSASTASLFVATIQTISVQQIHSLTQFSR